MTRRALFRADASAALGHGHLTRCLALAHALSRRGFAPEFFCREDGGEALEPVRRAGFRLRLLRSGAGEEEDVAAILGELKAAPAVVVTDSYAITAAAQARLRAAAAGLLAVDDTASLDRDCDLLLNQNPHACAAMYAGRVPKEAGLLLGLSYALLRPEFAAARPRTRPQPERARRVLVTMGGADAPNATLRVLEALAAIPGPIEATAVLGASNPNGAALEAFASASPLRPKLVRSPSNLASIFSQADLAVAGAGSTSWELARLGVPAALVVIADNQAASAESYEKLGGCRLLGRLERLEPERLVRELAGLIDSRLRRETLAEAGPRLVDGRGAERVAEKVDELAARTD